MPVPERNVWIIDENYAGFALIRKFLVTCDYLPDNIVQFPSIVAATDTTHPAVIFVDDTLLEHATLQAVEAFKQYSANTPVILLASTDGEQATQLAATIAAQDYLVKKEITLPLFRKAVLYAIDRKKMTVDLQRTRDDYMAMFHRHPLPMWVYEISTKAFLAVNEAAVHYYGYSEQDFLSMTILDIRPPDDIPALQATTKKTYQSGFYDLNHWTHIKRDGSQVKVHIYSHNIYFEGKDCKIVTAVNVDREVRMNQLLTAMGIEFR